MTPAPDAMVEKLRAAVTDDEARLAIYDAMLNRWPGEGPNSTRGRAEDVLNGDPAGWLGVGVLMVPKGIFIRLTTEPHPIADVYGKGATAAFFSFGANRLDCALVLAALTHLGIGGRHD